MYSLTDYSTLQNASVLKHLTSNHFFKEFHIKELKFNTELPKPVTELSSELVLGHAQGLRFSHRWLLRVLCSGT